MRVSIEAESGDLIRCLIFNPSVPFYKTQLSEEDLHRVRKAAHYCQPVGDDRFRQQIEQRYGVKLGQMERGRPRKVNDELLKV